MKIKKIETSVGLLGKTTNQYSESTKDAYACDYINKINEKSLIDLCISTDITLSTSNTKINYNTERTKIGTKLTNYDGGVKIGAGVSKVKVTINQNIQNSVAGVDQKRIELFVNSTSVRTAYNTVASVQYNGTEVTIVAVLSVQEDDVLYVNAAYNTKASVALSNNYSTFIVEEI